MQSIVGSLLHAKKLFFGIQAIAAELLGQDRESCGVWRIELADSSGLRYDAGDDGILGIGVAVRVGSVASGRLAPEDHVFWVAAVEALVRLSLAKCAGFTHPKASIFSRSHSTLLESKSMESIKAVSRKDAYTNLMSARPAFTGAARAPGKPQTLNR